LLEINDEICELIIFVRWYLANLPCDLVLSLINGSICLYRYIMIYLNENENASATQAFAAVAAWVIGLQQWHT